MIIQTKYNLGQKCWTMFSVHEKEWIVCKGCGGKGMINLANEESVTCPKCWGRTGEYIYTGNITYTDPVQVTIGMVKTEMKENGKIEIGYMVREYGVGSGSVFREGDLFPTKKCAIEEKEKRQLRRKS